MNIQEMIDSRIEELRAQPDGIMSRPHHAPQGEPEHPISFDHEDRLQMEAEILQPESGYRRSETDYQHPVSRPPAKMSGEPRTGMDLPRFSEEIDIAMTQVANQVLEITERLAGDYARFEKEILESRLAVLRSAESVLDVALSLRREARNMMLAARSSQPAPQMATPADPGPRQKKIADPLQEIDAAERAMINDRASMHDRGVAALFRRTL